MTTSTMIFTCPGCEREFPLHRRAARSPHGKAYCAPCDEKRRVQAGKRSDQGRRR